MKKSLIMLALAMPIALSGCVVAVGNDDGFDVSSHHEDKETINRRHLAQLQPMMSYHDVKNLMGVADFNESYQKNGEQIQVLFYRTNRLHKDGLTTKDECTPLIFKNNQLVSWGENAYKQI
jgi:hypothetical protein